MSRQRRAQILKTEAEKDQQRGVVVVPAELLSTRLESIPIPSAAVLSTSPPPSSPASSFLATAPLAATSSNEDAGQMPTFQKDNEKWLHTSSHRKSVRFRRSPLNF